MTNLKLFDETNKPDKTSLMNSVILALKRNEFANALLLLNILGKNFTNNEEEKKLLAEMKAQIEDQYYGAEE